MNLLVFSAVLVGFFSLGFALKCQKCVGGLWDYDAEAIKCELPNDDYGCMQFDLEWFEISSPVAVQNDVAQYCVPIQGGNDFCNYTIEMCKHGSHDCVVNHCEVVPAGTQTYPDSETCKAGNPKTTAAPVTTSESSVTTTAAPVTTTAAPITTTEAPVTTTAAPDTTTEAPVTTTAAPVTTTDAQLKTTATPATGRPKTSKPTTSTARPGRPHDDGPSHGDYEGLTVRIKNFFYKNLFRNNDF